MADKSQEYYGSVKGMPQNILENRLAEAEANVAELRDEKQRRSAFTSTQVMADRLHRLLHLSVDCDYYYSDWPNPNGCRSEFHELAKQLELWYERIAVESVSRRNDDPLGYAIALIERVTFGHK